MIIGVPKEIKNHEYRVGMVPASVRELTARNHTVFVQSGAGNGIGCPGASGATAPGHTGRTAMRIVDVRVTRLENTYPMFVAGAPARNMVG